jgi:gliding motility-associated-like protein
LSAWFKPDGLTIGNVSTWTTTFPIGASSVSVIDAATPYPQATRTPVGDVSNYNTTVHFTNSNSNPNQRLINTSSLDLLDNISSSHQGTFVLAYYLPAITQNDHFVTYNETVQGFQCRNLGNNGRLAIGKSSNSSNATRNWPESNKPQVISYKGNRSNSSSMKFYNQSYYTTTSSASGSSGAVGLYFGVKPNGGSGYQGNSGLNGYLHEVLFYDDDLTNAELLKVHSYLAIKYGATLVNTGGGAQGDYTSTLGGIIWDASLSNSYHNDVIGIGRDDSQGLLQKQSHAFDDVTRVYLDSLRAYNTANSGAFSANVSYLMVGSNNGGMCDSPTANLEVPANSSITTRLAREWKVTKTNMADTFSVDLTTLNCAAFSNASCLRLLVDDDGDFTNASVNANGNGIDMTILNGIITVSGMSNLQFPNNSTRYFTIGVIEPDVDLGSDTVICPGDSIRLNATNPSGNYVWQDSSTDSIFFAKTPNTYWAQVNVNGCIAADTINITVGPTPVVNFGPDTAICIGDTITLDATNGGASYLWNTGDTTASLSVFNAGTFWVNVINGCGLTSDTLTITTNTYPVLNLGPDSTLCAGDTLGLNAMVTNGQYLWQNGDTVSNFEITIAGTYWVEVTTNKCTSKDSIITQFTALPVVDLGPDSTICAGDFIRLEVNHTNATFLWQSGWTDSLLTTTFPGQYWLAVTQNNCSSSDTMNVFLDALPIVDFGNDTTVCDGGLIHLDASNSNGQYLWQDGSVDSAFNVSVAGNYWVKVQVRKCVNSDTLVVSYNPIPIINLGNDTVICAPDTLFLDASFSNSSYRWQDNSNKAFYGVTQQGRYFVQVSRYGCTFKDTIDVGLEPKPSANLGADTVLCPGETYIVNSVARGATFLWQDGSTQNFYQVLNAGMYWINVTKGNCQNSDTLIVTRTNPPVINIGNDSSFCVGDSVLLKVDFENATYHWSTNSTDSSIYVKQGGEYWVDVTNACGTTQDKIFMDTIGVPIVDLGEDQLVCLNKEVVLSAYWNESTYLWNDGTLSDEFIVYEAGEYMVTVTNNCGTTSDTIEFEFENCDCSLYIPNAFTPNGDDLDELFGPVSNCSIKAYEFVVFNRWGMEVFTTTDPTLFWDGKTNNKLNPVGVYSYLLKFNFEKKGDKAPYVVKYGEVRLIR